jgi:hypothetical protein
VAGWRLLNNGAGGLDWAGLPYAVALLCVADPADFVESLQTVRYHRAPEEGTEP